MIRVFTRKNYLAKDNTNPFVFHSRTLNTLSEDALVEKMQEYNSTLTEADIKGVLSVLKTTVLRYTGLGYLVKLPFGNIWAVASGTCQNMNDSFNPKSSITDHSLDLHFKCSNTSKEELLRVAEYEKVSSTYIMRPSIIGAFSFDDDGNEIPVDTKDENGNDISSLNFSTGDIVRLRGEYLKVSSKDINQGVVLISENDESQYRISRYSRNSGTFLDFTIPVEIPTGKYSLQIVTKPGVNRYETAICPDKIIVE
ncbi:MAG: DUF4469 domain-containing protein [Spirochaetaceae bacterium]|nr:DUF4469 domain-containing protein [Spirochaetaceae bacterium]